MKAKGVALDDGLLGDRKAAQRAACCLLKPHPSPLGLVDILNVHQPGQGLGETQLDDGGLEPRGVADRAEQVGMAVRCQVVRSR